MLLLLVILLSLFFFVLTTKEANAIIVVVPAVLIPIVSTVVWIIGAITAPVVALSALHFKMKKKSWILGVLFGIGLLLLLGIIITIVFKLLNPQRPIY